MGLIKNIIYNISSLEIKMIYKAYPPIFEIKLAEGVKNVIHRSKKRILANHNKSAMWSYQYEIHSYD